MNAMRFAAAATILVAIGCSANPPATSTPQPPPTAAPTETPRSTPSATAQPGPTATAAPMAAATPMDGKYVTSFTKEELDNPALLLDPGEVNDDNWGDWTLTFASGRVSYIQTNVVVTTNSSGTFAVDGDAVTMAFDTGDNRGETFAFRWTLSGSTLSFTRDVTIGVGPTPFLVKAWRRDDAIGGDPLVCCGARLFPGTYQPRLQPGMTFTVDHEVDLDCVPGYRCRGDVNVDQPDWLDLEFGNEHGSELMIFGLDKLPNPAVPGQFVDLPSDFAAWIASFEGVSIAKPAHDVVVGGVRGVQLDIETGHLVASFGPPDSQVRLTAFKIQGREVVIQETLGPENTVGDFEAAVDGLQAVIDSISWGSTGQIVLEDVGNDFVGTQIWIENADGSGARKLVSDSFTDNSVSLSPDGQTAVFYSSADMTKPGKIMFVDVASGDLTELNTGRPAGCDNGPEGDAWSPDGTRIAFASFCFGPDGNFTGGGIFTVRRQGNDLQQLTRVEPDDQFEDHRASWSPDGSKLVFARIDTSVSPEKSAIFTVNVDGSDPHQLTPWALDANDPDWSPDGHYIVFNSPAEAGGDQNIFVAKPDGSGLTQLTSGLSTWPDGGQATYHPTWSPDGSQILFSHAPATDGLADLFVMNSDGSDPHVLRATSLAENHATWGGSW